MTDDTQARVDLDALDALLAKATRGKWCKFDSIYGNECVSILLNDKTKGKPIVHWQGFDGSDTSKAKRHANAALIVAVVNALPEMIAELRAARLASSPAAGDQAARAEGFAAGIEAAATEIERQVASWEAAAKQQMRRKGALVSGARWAAKRIRALTDQPAATTKGGE